MSRERPVTFGPGGHLLGVACEPLDQALGRQKPAVLLANVGVAHRVGPFRLNVELARRLAAAGFYSLRFDYAGLGDSEPSRAGGTDAERTLAEAQAAMELVQRRTGIDRFVIVGLCTGADRAHTVAAADPRIVGIVLIDGYAYPTPLFHLVRLLTRGLSIKRLRVYAAARRRALRARLSGAPRAAEPYRAVIPSPDRRRVGAELAAMAERGTRQLHLFTASTDYIYNYAGQFWHMYPGLRRHRGLVQTERDAELDHTFSVVAMQRRVVERICRWMVHI